MDTELDPMEKLMAEEKAGEDGKKNKFLKIIALLKVYSTLKIMKEDNLPVELVNGLFIGSIGAASNLKALKDNQITHIVVAASGVKKYYPDEFSYLQLNLLDSPDENIRQYFDEAGSFIHNGIANGGKVLVHCHAGISRSSAIVLAYLLKYHIMTLDAALEMIKTKRDKINPNQGFIKQLKEYEEELTNAK